VNGTDKTIPAMSVVRITGKEKSSGGRTVPEAKLTDETYGFGAQFLHRVTNEKDTEPGKTGHFCYPLMAPVLAAFETKDGTPAAATIWGPIAGEAKLRANVGGYRVIGKPVQGSRNSYAVLVVAEPLISLDIILTEALENQSEAQANAEGASAEFLFTVCDTMGLTTAIEAGTRCRANWDNRRSKFAVIAAACGPGTETPEA
jgi:hypothetical protein